MKYLLHRWALLALLGLLCQSATAQTFDDARKRFDHLFGKLDTSRVTTGFLLDYGIPLADVSAFTGSEADTAIADDLLWRRLYATLWLSTFTHQPALPALAELNERALELRLSSTPTPTVPLLLLFAPYQRLHPNALEQQRLTLSPDSQLVEVPGANPYLTQSLVAVAPLVSAAPSGDVTFRLDPTLFVNTSGAPLPATLDIDFDDEQGYRTLSTHAVADIHYKTAGEKLIRVRFQLKDHTHYARARFFVHHIADPERPAATSHYANGVAFPFAPSGNIPGATVTVAYGSQHSQPLLPGQQPQLYRPLIVVEGYDPWPYNQASGGSNWSFSDFARKNYNGGLSSVYDASRTFGQVLEEDGKYDLIFIDFNDGTADITANAQLVENVVQWVKNHRVLNPATSTLEESVVLGQSMGGLIARYALADLDKRGIDPAVHLFISQDAPHHGANVPLALQATVRLLSFVKLRTLFGSLDLEAMVPLLREARQLLDRPASQQLLVAQYARSNTFLDGPYRAMITYPSGWAPSYESVAMSNGSECGQSQPFAPYSPILAFRATVGANLFGLSTSWIGKLLQIPSAGLGNAASLATSSLAGILGAIVPFVGNRWNTTVNLRTLSDPGTISNPLLAEGRAVWLTRILGFRLQFDLFNFSFFAPANLPNYDAAPGGTFFLADVVGPPAINTGAQYQYLSYAVTATALSQFCFVPTPSALDFPGPITQAVLYTPYSGNAPTGTASRFDTFVTQEPHNGEPANERHVQFRARNARWTFAQLTGSSFTPSCAQVSCNPQGNQIEGPPNVCTDGTTYSFVNMHAQYTWLVTGSLGIVNPDDPTGALVTILGPTNQSTIVVKPTGTSGGTIRLLFQSDCWSSGATLIKNVSSRDTPSVLGSIDRTDDGDPCYPTFTLAVPDVPGAAWYTWSLQRNGQVFIEHSTSSPTTSPSGGSPTPPSWNISPRPNSSGGSVTINVTAYSNCSAVTTSSTYFEAIAPQPPSSGCRPAGASMPISIFPVPADDVLNVELIDTDSTNTWPADPAFTTSFQVIDAYGQLWLNQSVPGREADLPVMAIPTGFYVLRVQRGARLETTQISIQH